MGKWRRNLARLAVGSAATGAFLWLFLREVDLSEAWSEIVALPPWTMAVAVALVVANVVIMSVRWRYLLEGAGYRLGLWKLFSTVAVGRGANNILPARGGDLLRIEALRERQVPVFVTAGTLFAERLLDGVILSAWILFGALAIGQGGAMLLTGIALSAGAALGVLLVALAARDPDRAERFAWRATRRLPARWHTRFTRAAAHFVDGLGAFRGRTPTRGHLRHLGGHVARRRGHVLRGRRVRLRARPSASAPTSCSRASATSRSRCRRRPPGIGTFDYLTLLAAKGIDVPVAKATAYVITMHALAVLP